MPAEVWFNAERVKAAFRDAAEETLDEMGEKIASDARSRAPIRKVFKERKGYRRKYRSLTQAEKGLAIRRANNYYGRVNPNEFKRRRAVSYIQNYARVQLRRPGSANSLAASRELRSLGVVSGGRFTSTSGAFALRGGGFSPGPEARAAMTSRGRYEATSGRGIHRQQAKGGNTKVQVGGKLKASISSSGPIQTSSGMKVEVEAGIRYAKYVEFPTIRTAAQPFLLPALHGQRGRFANLLASNLSKALRR